MNQKLTLINFLKGINDNQYQLTAEEFETNNLIDFKTQVMKNLELDPKSIELILIYLYQNNYIVFPDGIKLTEKAIEELKTIEANVCI